MNTPLHEAIIALENVENTSELFAAGADIHIQNKNGNTPLFSFILSCRSNVERAKIAQVFQLFKDNGIDDFNTYVNEKTGAAALHYATSRANLKLILELIEFGSDVHLKDNTENTVLHYLAGRAQFRDRDVPITKEILQMFLDAGVDIKVKNNSGSTPLHHLAKTYIREGDILIAKQTFQAFLDAGAEINARDNNENTPLHDAIYRINSLAIPIIIAANADVNARNNNGQTPLHIIYAPSLDNTFYVRPKQSQMLLDANADPNIKDENEMTPLHAYIKSIHPIGDKKENVLRLIQILVDANIDLNARDNKGKTPLHYAADSSYLQIYVDIIKKLLQHDADPTITDRFGETPLDKIHGKSNEVESARRLLKSAMEKRERNTRNPSSIVFASQEKSSSDGLIKRIFNSIIAFFKLN